MPSCLNILLILKQKSKRRNLNMKSQKDLSNSTMGKMSIKKPLFRESRGATHMVVMHRRELSALPKTYELAPRSQARGLYRLLFIFRGVLTLSPSPSSSFVPQRLVAAPSPPVPCETPEPSPTVST